MTSNHAPVVPKNTRDVARPTQAIVSRLERDTIAIFARPDVLEIMRKGGYTVIGKGIAHTAREVPMWKEVIEKANVKFD